MPKLFRVDFARYVGTVYVVADSYDQAAERGLVIGIEESRRSVLNSDGSLNQPENIEVQRVELLTDNLQGLNIKQFKKGL